MLAIKNNIMAGNAARHLGTAYDSLARSVERLASGLRINSAKDDAAGMAVRELIRADIAVLQQGARNGQDAISMLQTMEGAMGVIDENLIRMKELAEQAATGSYSSGQRDIMQAEFAEMADEIDRIAKSTSFNGITLLDDITGTATVTIHVGTTTTIVINKVNMTKDVTGLNLAATTIGGDGTGAAAALDTATAAINLKDTARASFGYKMNRLESTISILDIQAENLMSAESRISDVDVATEMAALTRTQVLAQAGIAMLAQANAMPQMALTLLR
ncbi:MAG: flagellin [Planctomycetes bacterium HGW-Planctomycetes-1]|nr:MAG: flagellin [Planctomycetes bacterium HGW-Planctomycetes-1]